MPDAGYEGQRTQTAEDEIIRAIEEEYYWYGDTHGCKRCSNARTSGLEAFTLRGAFRLQTHILQVTDIILTALSRRMRTRRCTPRRRCTRTLFRHVAAGQRSRTFLSSRFLAICSSCASLTSDCERGEDGGR